MRVGILGPFIAEHEERSAVPSAPKPRRLLAMLAIKPGQRVSTSTLCDELWGDQRPATAMTTLQTYIVQLRKLMAAALDRPQEQITKEVLITLSGGYLLHLPTCESDIGAFTQLTTKGRQALAGGDNALAATLFRRSLDLWRGPALSDVQTGRILQAQVMGLEECRFSALEERIEVDLRLGRHRELVGELTTLVAEHPLHESLHSHLMLALHRSGRPADALHVFRRIRNALISELGVEPSPLLHRLQMSILSSGETTLRAETPDLVRQGPPVMAFTGPLPRVATS